MLSPAIAEKRRRRRRGPGKSPQCRSCSGRGPGKAGSCRRRQARPSMEHSFMGDSACDLLPVRTCSNHPSLDLRGRVGPSHIALGRANRDGPAATARGRVSRQPLRQRQSRSQPVGHARTETGECAESARVSPQRSHLTPRSRACRQAGTRLSSEQDRGHGSRRSDIHSREGPCATSIWRATGSGLVGNLGSPGSSYWNDASNVDATRASGRLPSA